MRWTDHLRVGRCRRGLCALLCGAWLWSVSVSTAADATAADDAAEPGDASQATLYETATVRARALAKATASVTVLDREAIEALDVISVAELMRFIPGLDVVSSGPRGGLATAQVRGGDPNFTVVLLDGVPLNDGTDQFGGVVNLNSLPTVYVERVEIVRGPLSSFYGSAGLAGVVNIITRRGASDEHAIDFDVAAGNDSVLQTALALSRAKGGRDYFLGASWEQEADKVAQDDFEQFSLQGNLGIPLRRQAALRLTGRVTSWEGEDYPDGSGGPVFGTGRTRRSDHEEASLGLELRAGRPGRRHRIQLTGYRHELERESPEVPPHPSNPFNSVPAALEHTTFNNVQVGWAYRLVDARKAGLDVGVELDWEDGENDSTLFLPPELGGPVDGSYAIDRTTAGAFLEWVAERGPLLFELGARVDVPQSFDTELSPRAGLSYRFSNESTRLRVSAGRAFKLPSFFGLSSPPALGGNPELVPEIALGADVGIEHAFEKGDLTTSLTLFYNEFEDLITFDFASFGLINLDRVESRGAELALDWQATERIGVQANLTGQDVEDRETGEPLRQRPDWIGGARFTWNINERLRWELDGQLVSESVDEQIPVPARDHTSGYQLYGASLSYRVASAWTIHARIDNLADKDYETFIGFPGPGRSFRIGLRRR